MKAHGVKRRHGDERRNAIALTLVVVLAGGFAFKMLESPHAPQVTSAATTQTAAPPHADDTRRLFDAAVVMLHAKRYDDAATALHRVLAYAPKMPEAHVNMGFALLGSRRLKEAHDFFQGATALAPGQANAYYGLAMVYEAQGDMALATGAMRTYLHLARDERPEHLARARAALWEWEQRSPRAASTPK